MSVTISDIVHDNYKKAIQMLECSTIYGIKVDTADAEMVIATLYLALEQEKQRAYFAEQDARMQRCFREAGV